MRSYSPQPSAVPVVHGLDADDVRAACQNAVEVFAEEQHAELCREVAEYMREVLLVDLDRAAAPSAPKADDPVQGVNAQLLEALNDAKKHERHRNNAETRFWCDQYKRLAIAAIAAARKGEGE